MILYSVQSILVLMMVLLASVARAESGGRVIKILECSGELGRGIVGVHAVIEIEGETLIPRVVKMANRDHQIQVVEDPEMWALFEGDQVAWVYLHGRDEHQFFGWEHVHQARSSQCQLTNVPTRLSSYP